MLSPADETKDLSINNKNSSLRLCSTQNDTMRHLETTAERSLRFFVSLRTTITDSSLRCGFVQNDVLFFNVRGGLFIVFVTLKLKRRDQIN
jgi:hypothetical protein